MPDFIIKRLSFKSIWLAYLMFITAYQDLFLELYDEISIY